MTNNNNMIRILDHKGHLLFMFNPDTNDIEIKGLRRGGENSTTDTIYTVNVDDLKRQSIQSVLSFQSSNEIKAIILLCPNCGKAWTESAVTPGACVSCGSVWKQRLGTFERKRRVQPERKTWADERKRFY